jgi:WD40 repeat protein
MPTDVTTSILNCISYHNIEDNAKFLYFGRYEDDRHDDFVRGLAWHPRSENLYSCGWDKQVLEHKLALSPNKMEVNGVIEKGTDQEQK